MGGSAIMKIFELKKLRDGARLSTLQSIAPDHTEHASIYLRSTFLYPKEHCSVTYGVMLHTNKSNDLVS